MLSPIALAALMLDDQLELDAPTAALAPRAATPPPRRR